MKEPLHAHDVKCAKELKVLAVSLAAFILLLDLVSKFFIQAYLPLNYSQSYFYPYGGIGIFKNFLGIEFSINHATNKGAAWGMFSEFQIPLLIFRILFVIALCFYSLFLNKKKNQLIPLLLIVSGAIGNICDYFLYGHVIDMFHFLLWGYDYPVFNIADTAIFIGIGWLFLQNFKKAPA